MKKIILSVLVVFMALNLAMAQNNPENKPEITFEKITHDFGTIKEVDGRYLVPLNSRIREIGRLLLFRS